MREQATRVEKRKVVMATEYSQRENAEKHDKQTPAAMLENTVENTLGENSDNNGMVNMHYEIIAPETLTNIRVHEETDENSINTLRSTVEYKALRECFIANYEVLQKKPIDERVTTTYTIKKIDGALLVTIDEIL